MSRHEEMHFGMHFHSSMSIKTILAAHHHTMNTYSVLVRSNDEEKAFNSKTNKIGTQKMEMKQQLDHQMMHGDGAISTK